MLQDFSHKFISLSKIHNSPSCSNEAEQSSLANNTHPKHYSCVATAPQVPSKVMMLRPKPAENFPPLKDLVQGPVLEAYLKCGKHSRKLKFFPND